MSTLGNFSDYGEEMIVDHLCAQSWWAAIMTTAGGESGSVAEGGAGVEVSAGDYARIAVTLVKNPAAEDRARNTSIVAFGTPAVSWGTGVEVRLYNAVTAGQSWLYFPVSPGVAMDAGAPVRIPVDGLIERIE